MRSLFRVRLLLLALIFATAAGSSLASPDDELTIYREAFVEAKNAGDILYGELAAVIEKRTATPADAPANPCVVSASGAPPRCFDPDQVVNKTGVVGDPAIQARRLALRTVAEYNLAIADLAEGKSADEIQSRVSGLAALAGELAVLASATAGGLPALVAGPAVATIGNVASRLEQGAATANARRSLLQNAGMINQIIDLLIADTRPMYDVYLIGQSSIALREPTREATQKEQAKITRFHESLTAYVKLLRQAKASMAGLISAANTNRKLPDPRVVIGEAMGIKEASAAFWQAVRNLRN
jgi:hypothetical protein